YFRVSEVMTTTKDVILEKWEGEEDDSYGVEAQGSLYCEVRVCGNVLIRHHPMNEFYFE
ncbi:hypothetical protein ADUPG1_005145, partial [Aduncisulcus paluster]